MPRKPQSNGRRNNAKGKQEEREVAELLRSIWPDARRGIGQARSAGEVPDVDGTPYWVEVKLRSNIAAMRFMDQATEAGKADGRPPLVIMREAATRARPVRRVAVLDLDLLLGLLARGEEK